MQWNFTDLLGFSAKYGFWMLFFIPHACMELAGWQRISVSCASWLNSCVLKMAVSRIRLELQGWALLSSESRSELPSKSDLWHSPTSPTPQHVILLAVARRTVLIQPRPTQGSTLAFAGRGWPSHKRLKSLSQHRFMGEIF